MSRFSVGAALCAAGLTAFLAAGCDTKAGKGSTPPKTTYELPKNGPAGGPAGGAAGGGAAGKGAQTVE